MKKLIEHPRRLAVIAAAIYLAGLLAGLYALSFYPLSRQKRVLLSRANTIAREFTEGGSESADSYKGAHTHIFVYDAAGECLLFASRGTNPEADFHDFLAPFLPRVLAGEEIFSIRKSIFSTNIMRLWLIAGVPSEPDGGAGAVFIIDSLMNLQESMIGYVCYFTLFYGLSVYLLISTARKRKKLEEMQRNYIDNVTHALKSPIASVKALAEALGDRADDDPDKRNLYYGMILREVNLQSHMVQEILNLSKLQRADMDFSRTRVDAADLFSHLEEKYAPLCECAEINLVITDAARNLPPLYTNAACLGQLLDILMDNALKFVDEGGEIRLDATVAKSRATISVRDDGAGISREDLPHVFERFYKGGGRRNGSGSGLGLTIAREMIDGLKEKIWVESEEGKGAAFFFTVRLG